MTDIFELAHVARKVEPHQASERRIGDALGFHAQLFRALLQKETGQRRNVFGALAQRRQTQPDHVEAVKKIFAKSTELDPVFEILMGRGDDAHIGAHRIVATDAVELAVTQHAQKPRLQVERHVADLVEKQRSTVGLLEPAAARGLCAGEGTPLVAEKL